MWWGDCKWEIRSFTIQRWWYANSNAANYRWFQQGWRERWYQVMWHKECWLIFFFFFLCRPRGETLEQLHIRGIQVWVNSFKEPLVAFCSEKLKSHWMSMCRWFKLLCTISKTSTCSTDTESFMALMNTVFQSSVCLTPGFWFQLSRKAC